MTRNIMSVDSGEQYKDATHWITVGGTANQFGVSNSYGSIEPNTISVNSTDYTITKFKYETDIDTSLDFEFHLDPKVSQWKYCTLIIDNLMNGRSFSRVLNSSRGISDIYVTTGIFDAADIGKTIPLKISINYERS